MLILALTSLAVFIILLVNEWWWRGRTHGEISRKFVHITVGTFVAMWPLYLTWDQIRLLSVLFVIVVLISRQLNIFKAIHSVQRPTFGEICFGASVGILTFLTHSPAIYAVALLHMSLADGLAAIVGVKYGNGSAFTFLGAKKSLQGCLTFFVVSLALLTCYGMIRGIGFPLYFVPLSLVMTALEAIAIRGLDNLAIPLVLAAILHVLS